MPITVLNTYSCGSGLRDGDPGPAPWAPTTGRETGSSTSAAQMIQWESLTWDQLGNLTERNDHINALDEKYGYDELRGGSPLR